MKTILPAFGFLALTACLQAQTNDLPAKVYRVDQIPVQQDSSRERIQIMDGHTPYLSNLEVHVTILEPGKSAHPPHTHTNTEELIIVRNGILKVTIAGKTKVLGPGGLAMAMPGDEHGAVNIGDTKTSYYLLKYTKNTPPNIERANQYGGSVLVDWSEAPPKKTDRGERREQFNHATSLFEKFDMHSTALNKGEISHSPHTHLQEEILIVRKGTVKMQIGDRFYDAGVGDLIFLPSMVPHALTNTTDGQCEYFAFQWN